MNKLPNADISLFPITLGTMTYGSPVSFDDAVDLTLYALSQGINHIDTANMYEGYNRSPGSSGGVAEEILGKALRSVSRQEVILATKVGMKVGTEAVDEGTSPAAIHAQLTRSLRRLGTDYVDFYYLHRPDETVPWADIAGAMAEEIQAGRIRYYGVSNYSAPQLQALLDAADLDGLPRPVICQPPLSLLKPDALDALVPLCRQEGIGVVPYQIYQGGLLTGKYRRDQQVPAGSRGAEMPSWLMARDDALFDRLEEIQALADREGIPMAWYALRWVLRQEAVVSALVGVKRKEQVDQAIAAL